MAALAAGGLLLMLSGPFGLREGFARFSLLRSGLGSFSAAYPAATLLCALLCLPAGLGLLLLGQAACRREVPWRRWCGSSPPTWPTGASLC